MMVYVVFICGVSVLFASVVHVDVFVCCAWFVARCCMMCVLCVFCVPASVILCVLFVIYCVMLCELSAVFRVLMRVLACAL